VDIEALEASLAGEPESHDPEPELSPVRDWLTPREFAEVRGIRARSTVSRWRKGEHLPARPDQRPWEPDAVPQDLSLGPNYCRLWVPGISPAFWATELVRARLAACLTDWPKEQGWLEGDKPGPRCLEPLEVAKSVKCLEREKAV
jgi:hypothetical protein